MPGDLVTKSTKAKFLGIFPIIIEAKTLIEVDAAHGNQFQRSVETFKFSLSTVMNPSGKSGDMSTRRGTIGKFFDFLCLCLHRFEENRSISHLKTECFLKAIKLFQRQPCSIRFTFTRTATTPGIVIMYLSSFRLTTLSLPFTGEFQ